MWFGTEENFRKTATSTKAAPSTRYGILTLSMLASVLPATTLPKMAKLTSSGPMVVPKLLTPPAMVSRCAPVAGLPITIASGLAAICCSEKPRPTMNRPDSIKPNEPLLAAGKNSSEPIAEISRPRQMPFL